MDVLTARQVVSVLQRDHGLSSGSAQFVADYAREALEPATWPGCTFTVTYNANLGRYVIR